MSGYSESHHCVLRIFKWIIFSMKTFVVFLEILWRWCWSELLLSIFNQPEERNLPDLREKCSQVCLAFLVFNGFTQPTPPTVSPAGWSCTPAGPHQVPFPPWSRSSGIILFKPPLAPFLHARHCSCVHSSIVTYFMSFYSSLMYITGYSRPRAVVFTYVNTSAYQWVTQRRIQKMFVDTSYVKVQISFFSFSAPSVSAPDSSSSCFLMRL